MRTLLCLLSILFLAACGSDPKPPSGGTDPVDGPRPGSHGCAGCSVQACYMPDTPNRLSRVELRFTATVDGEPVSRTWDGAMLELKPKTGISQGFQLKTDGWKKEGENKLSVKEPDLKPAPGGWKDVEATLTLQWKKLGKTEKTVLSTADHGIKVEISACK